MMLATRDLASRATRSVVMMLPEPLCAMTLSTELRRTGWRVHSAESLCEMRKLVQRVMRTAVLLPAEGLSESGWLVCAKLLRSQPRLRVILVGELSERNERFARFVGAELIAPGQLPKLA